MRGKCRKLKKKKVRVRKDIYQSVLELLNKIEKKRAKSMSIKELFGNTKMCMIFCERSKIKKIKVYSP